MLELIGWGEETIGDKTVPYWIITNTWNSDWGESGVIRIKRGTILTSAHLHFFSIKGMDTWELQAVLQVK